MRAEQVRVLENADQCPGQRGVQVRLRADVQHDHVARRAHELLVGWEIAVRVDELLEEVVLVHAAPLAVVPDLGDDRLDPVHRAAFARAARRPGDEAARRSDERLARVDAVEQRDESVQVPGGGRFDAGPARETEAMPEPPALSEHVEASLRAELGDLDVDGLFERPEVPLDLLRAEEVVWAVAATGEQLRRQLEPDQAVGGEPEAGLALGNVVQPPHAVG